MVAEKSHLKVGELTMVEKSDHTALNACRSDILHIIEYDAVQVAARFK
jgi:hypothetical protein